MSPSPPPYGQWPSPLTAADLAQDKRLRDLAWDSDGRTLVWLEGRGADGVLLCQRPGQAPRELNPAGPSARARVGYGGGDFCVGHGHIYFAADDRLYRQSLDAGKARPLTPPFGQAAAPTLSPDGRFLAYVHSFEGIDRLAVVDTAGSSWPQILAEGADFYMQPAWHPTGRRLAWVEWDQPQMPWDGSRLVVADIARPAAGPPRIKDRRLIAGDAKTAVFQPTFSPDGRFLAYASDQRGWSNLWLLDLGDGQTRCLTPEDCDIARPAWVQGLRVFSFAADGKTLFFTRCRQGRLPLYRLDLDNGQDQPVDAFADYDVVEQPLAAPRGRGLAAIATASGIPPRLVAWDGRRLEVRARSASEALAPEQLSTPRAVSWPAADGLEVHGLYYPPAGFAGDGPPPLIVLVHGGPTSQAMAGYEPRNQYFATRGWAVLDLNYRGSTGYGRAYMRALDGHWGVHDVEDAVGGARHLVDQQLADKNRLVIMGGSAGGYTVLGALGQQPGFFRAGVCLYAVTDLFGLANETHKFEARYLDALVGPLPAAAALYRERSPLLGADAIADPVAVFQGEDDQVVPPAQAEAIVASLRRRGVPHHYRLFAGEGHGWRLPATIERFYQETEDFLRQHVLFS